MNFTDLSNGKNNVDFGLSTFRELRPSEKIFSIRKIWDLKNKQGWVYHYHWHPAMLTTIKPIGLYTVKDLIVTRPGGMILNRKLGFQCDTGKVALKYLPAEDDLFEGSSKNKIIIKEDVLVADGISFEIFGHWIVDYLPRFGITKDILQEQFSKIKILLVSYIPEWVLDLLCVTLNINRKNIILYHPHYDIVFCKQAIIPSYSYTNTFLFHSYFKEFYRSLCPMPPNEKKTRKILVSRSLCPERNRKFPLRAFFEHEASKRGYEIIHSERLSITEQMKIFSEAKVVIGEYGSGMHNAVFCDKGTVVGCLGFWNAVQLHIGFMMEHKNIYVSKGCQWPTSENNEYIIGCDEADIISFFGKVQLFLLDDYYNE